MNPIKLSINEYNLIKMVYPIHMQSLMLYTNIQTIFFYINSYSVGSELSGITDDATAFLGCDNDEVFILIESTYYRFWCIICQNVIIYRR